MDNRERLAAALDEHRAQTLFLWDREINRKSGAIELMLAIQSVAEVIAACRPLQLSFADQVSDAALLKYTQNVGLLRTDKLELSTTARLEVIRTVDVWGRPRKGHSNRTGHKTRWEQYNVLSQLIERQLSAQSRWLRVGSPVVARPDAAWRNYFRAHPELWVEEDAAGNSSICCAPNQDPDPDKEPETRTPAEKIRLLNAFKKSGLSRYEFCRREKLPENSLEYWLRPKIKARIKKAHAGTKRT